MNYEDESYVRLYTRDTTSWVLLGWEGQTVLLHMLRRFDRAGVFEIGSYSPDKAVAAVTGLPLELVETGLQRLLEDTWEQHEGCLVWPKYIEAQTAKRSDRARQKDVRKRRRDLARSSREASASSRSQSERHAESQPVTNDPAESPAVTAGHTESPTVTEGHTQSRAVTDRHAESHGVTQRDAPVTPRDQTVTEGHAESHGVTPSLAKLRDPPKPPVGVEGKRSLTERAKLWLRDPVVTGLTDGEPQTWPEVQQIARDFTAVWGHPVRLTVARDPRVGVIVDRLAEGRTPAELRRVFEGARQAEYIAEKPEHQTIQTLLRDPGQVDKFIALLRQSNRTGPPTRSAAEVLAEQRKKKPDLTGWNARGGEA